MSLEVKDGAGVSQTIKSSLDGADHVIHHNVAGAVADNAAETENPIPVAGKAVTSASYAPAYADDDRAVIAVDKATGGILAHTRKLTAADDFASIAGDVAHDAADSGAPVKIGGRATVTETGPTAVASNDRVNAWFDTKGRQVVKVGGKDLYAPFSSGARTTTQTSTAYVQGQMRGLLIWFKVTAVAGSPSLVVSIEAPSPVDGSYTTYCSFSAVTGTGTFVFKIYPGITAVAGTALNDVMPGNFRIVITPGTGDSCTYSLGFETQI